MSEPIAHQFKAFWLQAVNPFSTLLLVNEQAGGLQHPKMACRRLPGMLENGRDFTGGHSAVMEINSHQDSPPGGVRQGGENGLVSVGL